MLAVFSDDMMAVGSLAGGVAALLTAIVAIVVHRKQADKASTKAVEAALVTKEELKTLLSNHVQSINNNVVANRVQTTRYVDRKVAQVLDGQEILFGMITDVDAKVTKKANNVRVKELVSAETKG